VNLGAFTSREAPISSAKELEAPSDPLRTDALLAEAYPVSVRIDGVRSSVSVLLDCRFCDEVIGNSAILTVRLFSDVRWSCSQEPPRADLTIVTWKVSHATHWTVRAELGWIGNDELVLSGASAFFVTGDIEGLDGAPPNFMTDDDATIDAGLPNWDASFSPLTFAEIGGKSENTAWR
jgi:hypothetical protein